MAATGGRLDEVLVECVYRVVIHLQRFGVSVFVSCGFAVAYITKDRLLPVLR